ncbi:MAG: CPBP family glutamic-type intramembrane protease [Flavobacteriaceae bacterium]|nr:CPBP family glutamic-type intramembrane protease [Flavobacteriaceae bacterium]
MIKKIFKNRLLILGGILFVNIALLVTLDLIETFFKLNLPEIDNKEEIMNSIFFYSIFFIIVAPVLEEVLYRLPLRNNKLSFLSFLVGGIYIFAFDLLFVRMILGIYLMAIIYLIFSRRETSKIFVIMSILVFTISHIGNYNLLEVKSMSLLELLFMFLPQLILGIIVTLFRMKFSFKYALLYHVIYNLIIVLLAINFD